MDKRVTSRDGTSIAYDRTGGGPAVILVGGGLDDGSENAPLAPKLAEHFAVYNYARRGRGASGNTFPYAVEREIEDIDALVAEAGGSAHLFGASSGGALALEAAAAGLTIDKLAVYEVPYGLATDWPQRWKAYVDELSVLLDRGRPGAALEHFMRFTGMSDEDIAGAKDSPHWAGAVALAHTLAPDAACLRDGSPPTAQLAAITQPVLAITGSRPDGEADGPIDFERAAGAIAASIPQAEHRIVDDAGHMVDALLLAPVLDEFFGR